MRQLEAFLAPDRSAADWLRRHGAYWLVFTILITFSWSYWTPSLWTALGYALTYVPCQCLPITYLLLYWVLPKLLHGQHRVFWGRLLGWLAFSLILRFGVRYVLQDVLHQPLLDVTPNTAWRRLFDAGFMVTNNFVAVAAALKVFRYHYQKEQTNQQLLQQTLTAELKILQAQLQPHFLFNTLNTIYSLSLRQSVLAGPAARRLADLLRQMVDANEAAWVPLSQEIALLRNYIELEQLRYGPRLSVVLHLSAEWGGQRLAPLLLLPFVENAFKHGVAAQTGPVTIEARLVAQRDTLHFSLRNSSGAAPTSAASPGGLGLQNVRKRLALLYPGQHTLHVHAGATQHAVELSIPLWVQPPGDKSSGCAQQAAPLPLLPTLPPADVLVSAR